MCSVCGCGTLGHSHSAEHALDDHQPVHPYVFTPLAQHAHVSGLTQARMVQIEQDILTKNNQYAQENRQFFSERAMLVLNLVSSPGSGKTSLLTETIHRLVGQVDMAVIEGDQQTSRDAERIRATGVPALQINTGKGCHLDAQRVGTALKQLPMQTASLLFIENVGNLVCPSAFDLGEAHKVVILSVTEGEDKPIKYPDMFYAADLMLLNKIDLLPYLDFDVEQCIQFARQVNPSIQVISVSAKTGEGMQDWIKWLEDERVQQGISNA
ncbi:hydrogenase nickel incorporation protein HypB [Methylomonas sp. AM2-LC]|uniref:hydrogenase nickel incorporation protein HypB n=1 Tax=Methylomonas sp. AM2-LC TaxID=3153301 RepID=UPI0032667BBF